MIIEVSQLPKKKNWNNSVVDTKAHNAGKKDTEELLKDQLWKCMNFN